MYIRIPHVGRNSHACRGLRIGHKTRPRHHLRATPSPLPLPRSPTGADDAVAPLALDSGHAAGGAALRLDRKLGSLLFCTADALMMAVDLAVEAHLCLAAGGVDVRETPVERELQSQGTLGVSQEKADAPESCRELCWGSALRWGHATAWRDLSKGVKHWISCTTTAEQLQLLRNTQALPWGEVLQHLLGLVARSCGKAVSGIAPSLAASSGELEEVPRSVAPPATDLEQGLPRKQKLLLHLIRSQICTGRWRINIQCSNQGRPHFCGNPATTLGATYDWHCIPHLAHRMAHVLGKAVGAKGTAAAAHAARSSNHAWFGLEADATVTRHTC
mmetsp:Transcript_56756/g.161115  ORF Transcript_56756/g.161115 Transcript_56756/m.161115 type:complete len:331 (-) Transcript_56756:272-1264(-)